MYRRLWAGTVLMKPQKTKGSFSPRVGVFEVYRVGESLMAGILASGVANFVNARTAFACGTSLHKRIV